MRSDRMWSLPISVVAAIIYESIHSGAVKEVSTQMERCSAFASSGARACAPAPFEHAVRFRRATRTACVTRLPMVALSMAVVQAAALLAGSERPPAPPESEPAPLDVYFPEPHVHVTPPCYKRKGGWHDIAGALQHPVTGRWHLFVGPSWQHV